MRVRDCWNPLGMGGGHGKEVREGWEEEDFYADLLAHLDRQGKGHREEREKQSVRKLKGRPVAPCQEGKKAAVDQGICCRGMLALRSLEKFGPLHLSSLTTFTGQSRKALRKQKKENPSQSVCNLLSNLHTSSSLNFQNLFYSCFVREAIEL